MKAMEAIGGTYPVSTMQFAARAYETAMDPLRNPVKSVMDQHGTVDQTPPLLGIFNDIPWYKFRENEAHTWAKAGFSWIVNDAEHNQWQGYYGQEQNSTLLRLGLLPVQRLNREALSSFGDAYQLGARATMRPYGTKFEDAERYFKSISFPVIGKATPDDRGGYPVRAGDRRMMFTPDELRNAERQIQAWLQFETAEYIIDTSLRDRVLDRMLELGPNKACGFVGPFDVILREGMFNEINEAIEELFKVAARKGIHMGRVVGSGSMEDPKDIEDGIVQAIEQGARLIAVHYMTSDLTYHGAEAIAEPFFKACERCGF